jgi:hypothetical protein
MFRPSFGRADGIVKFFMSKNAEKNPLEDLPFSYRQYKNGGVSVFYKDYEVTVLNGKSAEKFNSRIENADEMEKQLIMAKITGNFKHGNEREAKLKNK